MKNTGNIENLYGQERFPSPSISQQTQPEIEERFDGLQNEISTLKTSMEKLIEQNGERSSQMDHFLATSSYSTQPSNNAIKFTCDSSSPASF